jgi:phosphatidylglycerol:prolipoprotein diacylglycerol transferase
MAEFLDWWQHLPEHMSPVIFHIGGFAPRYYGLMYIIAFVSTYLFAFYRIRHEERFQNDEKHLQGLMVAMMLGLFIGGRLGYVLFYSLRY